MAIRAIGKVARLYITKVGSDGVTFIKLQIPDNEQPKDSYFQLNQSHPNYNALYSLALSAAINRYPLSIRTEADIVSSEFGVVRYMVVDW